MRILAIRGTIRPPGFVGRDREAAALRDALAAGPAVVLVEGAAGVGKTRLIREFLASRRGPAPDAAGDLSPFRQPCTLGSVVDATVARLPNYPSSPRPTWIPWASCLGNSSPSDLLFTLYGSSKGLTSFCRCPGSRPGHRVGSRCTS